MGLQMSQIFPQSLCLQVSTPHYSLTLFSRKTKEPEAYSANATHPQQRTLCLVHNFEDFTDRSGYDNGRGV